MKVNEFIEALEDLLDLQQGDLDQNTSLAQLNEFDSLAVMSLLAFIDEQFGRRLSGDQFVSITTVRSLMELIGVNNFDD